MTLRLSAARHQKKRRNSLNRHQAVIFVVYRKGEGIRMTTRSPEEWARLLNFCGLERERDLPSGLLTAVCRQESGGNARARSGAGAFGLFQFMPATARGRGVDAADPRDSAEGAADYLNEHYDRFFRVHAGKYPEGQRESAAIRYALACYNWGQGNTDRAQARHGANWLAHAPSETKTYVRNIISRMGGDAGIEAYARANPTGSQVGVGGNIGSNPLLALLQAVMGMFSSIFAAFGIGGGEQADRSETHSPTGSTALAARDSGASRTA